MARPLVLIVGRWSERINGSSRGVYVPQKMLDAVARAGGEPMMAWPDDSDRAERLVDLADAVILPGGNDLDLRPFGVPEVHPREKHSPPAQDAADVTISRAALGRERPMLAICRGMQVLNVVMGGTIHAHFEETTVKHDGVPHEVDVRSGTLTESMLGGTRISGWSSHHQACDRLADGLRLSATADDGIVEGFESDDGRILGLQWHPEVDAADDPIQQAPFDWLVRQGR
ncbi:gamma-glutamyl-gamma-aminobutyrate hydrolase family protein [Microlunatus soli]|uniref:Putative glutamine amidotransferase n=1 Tax=Microlunatus soli TaxID=630515 RepID=A0A1H1VL55_9ACTN|nr:gamma-glutamyl-gamma-aminobutyrate hydrolase family protein [Microlunatus soli]SDS85503.1 putative glutamine amidotransferase [Microlunatus soli]